MKPCQGNDCYFRSQYWYFPFENGAVKMDAFAVEGRVIYEIHLWKHFWRQVKRADVGLNPIKMFELDSNILPSPGYVN